MSILIHWEDSETHQDQFFDTFEDLMRWTERGDDENKSVVNFGETRFTYTARTILVVGEDRRGGGQKSWPKM